MTKQTKEIADRLKKEYGSKSEIKKEIKRRFEMINNRFEALNNSNEDSDDFLSVQRYKFKKLTKTKSKNKIATGNLSNMSYKQLDDILHQSSCFLYSKWSTIEGRKEIRQKQINSLKQGGYDLTEEQFDIFTRLMKNAALKNLLEQNVLDSDQVLQMVLSGNRIGNITKALDIIGKELSGYTSKTNMYKASAEDLKTLINTLIEDENYQDSEIFKRMRG